MRVPWCAMFVVMVICNIYSTARNVPLPSSRTWFCGMFFPMNGHTQTKRFRKFVSGRKIDTWRQGKKQPVKRPDAYLAVSKDSRYVPYLSDMFPSTDDNCRRRLQRTSVLLDSRTQFVISYSSSFFSINIATSVFESGQSLEQTDFLYCALQHILDLLTMGRASRALLLHLANEKMT